MNRDETRQLLALAAATTRDWTPTSVDVDMWHTLLDDLDFTDALDALKAHARRTHHRPVPADIRAGVKAIRLDRLERAPLAVPAADPDDVDRYLADLRQQRHRSAGTLPAPDQRQLLSTFRDIPAASPAAIQAARAALPPKQPRPEPPEPAAPETWPCCTHCTTELDASSHRHRLACPDCQEVATA